MKTRFVIVFVVFASMLGPCANSLGDLTNHAFRVVDFSTNAGSPYDNPILALGMPDGQIAGDPPRGYYSIGQFGWIVLEFEAPLADVPGYDLVVWEEDDFMSGGAPDESADVFVSLTGDTWTYLGTVERHNRASMFFDIAGLAVASANYLKIVDITGLGDTYASKGFDLDAVTGARVQTVPIPPAVILCSLGVALSAALCRRREG